MKTKTTTLTGRLSKKNRTNSMKHNLVLPLHSMHHQLIHSDTDMMTYYKKKGQVLF